MISSQERYEGIQTILERCGKTGCLFLCLLSIVEEVNKNPVDLIAVIRFCRSKGWIDNDFYVRDSLAILCHYTGKVWTRREVTKLPSITECDYTIVNWRNDRTGLVHRRRRLYDTLENSVTVKEGYVFSYYIYSWEAA